MLKCLANQKALLIRDNDLIVVLLPNLVPVAKGGRKRHLGRCIVVGQINTKGSVLASMVGEVQRRVPWT